MYHEMPLCIFYAEACKKSIEAFSHISKLGEHGHQESVGHVERIIAFGVYRRAGFASGGFFLGELDIENVGHADDEVRIIVAVLRGDAFVRTALQHVANIKNAIYGGGGNFERGGDVEGAHAAVMHLANGGTLFIGHTRLTHGNRPFNKWCNGCAFRRRHR